MTARIPDTVRVLFVCTGNICRSPAAERLMTAAIGSHGVEVSSAGTHALAGHAIPAPMRELLEARGVSGSGFHARRVTERMLRDADLVLTMTRAHRATVVALAPATMKRVFALREFAALAARLSPSADAPEPARLPRHQRAVHNGFAANLLALRDWASLNRDLVGHAPADSFDVVDPYGLSAEVYRESFEQIDEALSMILRAIRD